MSDRLAVMRRHPYRSGGVLAATVAVLWLAWQTLPPGSPRANAPTGGVVIAEATSSDLATLEREHRELETRLRALGPRRAYVVVDRGNNRIQLRTRDAIELEAPVSTGSHAVLKETGGQQRTWFFETPAGRFPIQSERVDPVWTKPDWAFLETGEPIPERIADRREIGSLGEYALDLGDGYMIHGTLYERLLGRSVTHGCVRVGRDALRTIASRTTVGSQVFIY